MAIPPLSKDSMDFFSFRHTSPDDPSKTFGYDSKVISYDILEKNAEMDTTHSSAQVSLWSTASDGYARIRFDDFRDICAGLQATARALYPVATNDVVKILYVDQHVRCTTTPFRVTAQVGSDQKQFFIKQPSLKRAFGKAFYNLLVDRFIPFKFNEAGFAVDTVPGKEILDEDRKKLVESRQFVEDMVRLNVFTNIVCLDDILQETNANCSYSKEHGIYLFDFDRCFTDGDYFVMNKVKELRQKVDIPRIEQDERYKIHKNIRQKESRVTDLLAGISQDLPEETLAHNRGENNLANVIKKSLSQLESGNQQ